jgi:hypothetical protein
MPNDARLGLLVGMVVVIALAIVYRGKGNEPMPEAQVPGTFHEKLDSAQSSGVNGENQTANPSLATRKELGGNDLGGKKDPAKGVDGEPDSSNQPDGKQ